jgi:hypothetical protein
MFKRSSIKNILFATDLSQTAERAFGHFPKSYLPKFGYPVRSSDYWRSVGIGTEEVIRVGGTRRVSPVI